jgi:hypothetical protein
VARRVDAARELLARRHGRMAKGDGGAGFSEGDGGGNSDEDDDNGDEEDEDDERGG